METTMINKKEMINAKSANDLTEAVRKSLTEIEKFASYNEYGIVKTSFIDVTSFEQMKSCDIFGLISMASLNKRKELRNYLWVISKHPSITSINRYFKLLSVILRNEFDYTLVKPKKQVNIELKRKAYKEALAIAKKAYADYKTEKGDFYKLRLAKFQKI